MSGFLALLAGLQLPVGDSDWKDIADPSPKLAVRAGAMQHGLGGMVSVDWTGEQLTSKYSNPNGFDTGASAYRFRLLGHVVVERAFGPKLVLDGRLGAGLDVAHGSYDFTLLGQHSQDSRSDVGWAFELGGGAWWNLGSMEIGGEVALPIGSHDTPSKNGTIGFVYTSYDIDLLFGLRFRS